MRSPRHSNAGGHQHRQPHSGRVHGGTLPAPRQRGQEARQWFGRSDTRDMGQLVRKVCHGEGSATSSDMPLLAFCWSWSKGCCVLVFLSSSHAYLAFRLASSRTHLLVVFLALRESTLTPGALPSAARHAGARQSSPPRPSSISRGWRRVSSPSRPCQYPSSPRMCSAKTLALLVYLER